MITVYPCSTHSLSFVVKAAAESWLEVSAFFLQMEHVFCVRFIFYTLLGVLRKSRTKKDSETVK